MTTLGWTLSTYIVGFIVNFIICYRLVIRNYGRSGWTKNEKGTAFILSLFSWIIVCCFIAVAIAEREVHKEENNDKEDKE